MKEISPDPDSVTDLSADPVVFECSSDPETIVVDVVEALATAAGVDARDFEPRLHDVVDPEALAQIIATGGPKTRVSFGIGSYHVTVDGSGEVVVRRG